MRKCSPVFCTLTNFKLYNVIDFILLQFFISTTIQKYSEFFYFMFCKYTDIRQIDDIKLFLPLKN